MSEEEKDESQLKLLEEAWIRAKNAKPVPVPNSQREVLDTSLASSSKNTVSNTTPNLYVSKDGYIKEVLDTLKQPYVSTGTKQTNKPTLEEKKERKKERMLAFLLSNILYEVPLPVEIEVVLQPFASRVPNILLEAWVTTALNNEPGRRNGKLQRALWKSMVLYIASTKERKPDQQLTLKNQKIVSNTILRICPLTSRPKKPEQCRTCKQGYSCGRTW